MKQSDLIELIERTAPLSIAAPWDHSGVQVASGREEIQHLALCLDPLPQNIARALELGADMILTHHPLTMEPRFTDRLDDFHTILSLLFKADVPLYAAHTSLDANPDGPVAWLARELALRPVNFASGEGPNQSGQSGQPAQSGQSGQAGRLAVLERTGVLEQDGDTWACGFGLVGDLPSPLSPAAFAQALTPWTKGLSVRLAGVLPQAIRRLAICPGSGASLAAEAAAWGADLLITGDLKHHVALDSPLPILDVGHFCLEEEMMRRFAGQLADSGVRVTFVPGCDPLRPFGTDLL